MEPDLSRRNMTLLGGAFPPLGAGGATDTTKLPLGSGSFAVGFLSGVILSVTVGSGPQTCVDVSLCQCKFDFALSRYSWTTKNNHITERTVHVHRILILMRLLAS